MAASLSNWYHSSLWTRSRQVQVAPLLAQAEENARLGRPPAEAVVINMGDILADDPALLNAIKPKKHETLFGPSLGAINPGPTWTSYGKQEAPKDELTQETVKTWIAKSKEPLQPTTTLQALVNLKRPSIRLSPLAQNDGPEDAPSTHHGLEFEYDLDAAKGRIVMEVISPKSDVAPILIYESIVEGGFAKQLKIEDGAAFDLIKLETHPAAVVAESAVPAAAAGGVDTPGAGQSTAATGTNKKRFSAFAFRKRHRTSGPAVPVVDAQASAQPATAAAVEGQDVKVEGNEEEVGGVRVRIRIEALDENDRSLPSPNAQTTYLHFVRMGAPPAPAEGAETTEKPEDTRPWMVKVVKREATIGLHTFHLHEIYGLATGSNNGPAQPPSHTYPPTAGEEEDAHAQAYDFAGTECVLCLSEPREVVLLPCRHLVACKDCAINMIEFGAGGTLTHNDEPAATTPAVANPATPGAPGAATPAAEADLEAGQQAPAAPAVATMPRRKRKAKGWFCPVCRQPYTSMLRITTTPPEAKKLSSASDADLPEPAPVAPVISEPAVPPAAHVADGNNNASWKPSFLKNLGSKPAENAPATTAPEPAASTPAAASSATPAPVPARSSADPLGATSTEPAAPQ